METMSKVNIFQMKSNYVKSKSKNFLPEDKANSSFQSVLQELQNKSVSTKTQFKNKSSSDKLADQQFLEKLSKISQKDEEEAPAELLALLQSGNLSSEQKNLVGKLLLSLQNGNLKLQDIKAALFANKELAQEALPLFATGLNSEKVEPKTAENELLIELEKLNSALANNNLSATAKSSLESKLKEIVLALNKSDNQQQFFAEQDLNALLQSNKPLEQIESLLAQLKTNFSAKQATDSLAPQLEKAANLAAEVNNSLFSGQQQEVESTAEASSAILAQLKDLVDSKAAAQSPSSDQKNTLTELLTNRDLLQNISSEQMTANNKQDVKSSLNDLAARNSELIFNFSDSKSQSGNAVLTDLKSELKQPYNLQLKSQIVEQFKGQYSPDKNEIQIQLKPASLGKIDIALSYDNNELTGKMLVESQLVRSQLENSLHDLKADLAKQGINIQQFKIETAKPGPQQIEKQDQFAFEGQDAAFSDSETGSNQEYEQRHIFQGQYYIQQVGAGLDDSADNLLMQQQEIINRLAFSNEAVNLLA